MRARNLDRRIAVQSKSETEDALGTNIDAWSDAQTLWAWVSNGTAQERRSAAQERSTRVATFTVRSSTFTRAITPGTHRVSYDGLTWDIEGAVPSKERGRFIEITASARTS